jgi:hypothetical protein
MSPDKRKFRRFDLALPTTIEVVSPKNTDGQVLSVTTKNICEGGAWFITSQPLPPGTEVRVHLTLPLDALDMVKEKKTYVKAKGRVLRSGPEGMAVSFHKGFKLRRLVPLNFH